MRIWIEQLVPHLLRAAVAAVGSHENWTVHQERDGWHMGPGLPPRYIETFYSVTPAGRIDGIVRRGPRKVFGHVVDGSIMLQYRD